jgi:hypothetical protein
MAAWVQLKDVQVGSAILLPARLTAKSAAGVAYDTLGEDWTVTGTQQVTTAGVVTGTYTIDPRDQPVRVVAQAFAVGDVLWNPTLQRTGVVKEIGFSPADGTRWASWDGESYSGEGWQKVGHVTIP